MLLYCGFSRPPPARVYAPSRALNLMSRVSLCSRKKHNSSLQLWRRHLQELSIGAWLTRQTSRDNTTSTCSGLLTVTQPTSDGETEMGDSSLSSVVKKELGLRLVSTKGPVQAIVIDHLELPSAN